MSDMAVSSVMLNSGAAMPARVDSPEKVRDAAQQFEALLIAQILKSSHEGGSHWLSDGDDAAGEVATDYAEQQFSTALSQHGGLGLADMITKGLERKSMATNEHR